MSRSPNSPLGIKLARGTKRDQGRPFITSASMPITEITRRAIIDELMLGDHWWAGRLEEPDFLARIYPIHEMDSHDRRFDSAYGDVWQHRINNHDWTDDWIFTDDRFELMNGPDEVFLRFLAETVHPVVRPDRDIAEAMVASYNEHLRHDGYETHATGQISGRSVFGARSLMEGPRAIEQLRAVSRDVDAAYISQQITRMESSITTDPDLAIGTAKELVETVAKTILDELGIEYSKSDDLPSLVKAARKALKLVPEDIPESARANDTIRRLLSNLGTVTDALAFLRNAYGTGHGRSAGSGGLQPRHARLAVGSAATLATFLFETHEDRLATSENADQ